VNEHIFQVGCNWVAIGYYVVVAIAKYPVSNQSINRPMTGVINLFLKQINCRPIYILFVSFSV